MARAAAYQLLASCAGQWDSAFRRVERSDSGAVLPFLMAWEWAGVTQLAVHFSAVWTLWDRGDPGRSWCCASALALALFQTRALGAALGLVSIFGAAAAPFGTALGIYTIWVLLPSIRPGYKASRGHTSAGPREGVSQESGRLRPNRQCVNEPLLTAMLRHERDGDEWTRTKSRADEDGVFVGGHGVLNIGRQRTNTADR